MMKKGLRQRGFALLTAAMLALSAAGFAEIAGEEERFAPVIDIEAVDQVVAQGDADWFGDEFFADDVAPEVTITPEPTAEVPGDGEVPSEGEIAPETEANPESIAEQGAETASADVATPDAENTPGVKVSVEPTGEPEGETAPEQAEVSAAENAPEQAEDPAAEATSVAMDAPAVEIVPESTEVPEVELTPEPTEAYEPETTLAPTAAPEVEATPTPTALPKAVATPEPAATPEPEDAPEPAAIPEETSAPVETAVVEEAALFEAMEGAEALAPANYAAEAPTALTFSVKVFNMGKGERTRMPALAPDGSEAQGVTYTSSKPSVVKAYANGKLYARKKGVAKITATASNGVKASFKVRVVKAPSKVKLSATKLIIGTDETSKLTAKLAKGTASGITWTSSNPAVVEVDSAGGLRGIGAGKATVTARTFNGKKAKCTVVVLKGHTPTSLSFPSSKIYLGLKEKVQLSPNLGEGETAFFTFASNKTKIASVTAGGLVTANQKGTAQVTVKTHNGLTYKLTVVVTNAPNKVSLSKSSLSLLTGEASKLEAALPANTASAITWATSDAGIVAVDGSGNLVAVAPGVAKITVKTFNNMTASCEVTVTAPPEPEASAGNVPPNLTNTEMANNLRNSSSLGSKREAIARVAQMMLDAGYEPSFVAGLCANVYSEGTYGFFESSKYVTNYQKRPKYFCYLDGGDYYTLKDGQYVLTAVYLSQEEINAYTGTVEARLRFGEEKYYWNKWSGKKVYEVDLKELQAFIDVLTEGKWEGKFGLGVTQWTGARTRKLMAYYRKYAGQDSSTITEEQVIAAENAMILYDLQGDYKKVYTGWRAENEKALYCPEAAQSAGSWICLKYEIPANKEKSAVTRGERAAKFYKIMVGQS